MNQAKNSDNNAFNGKIGYISARGRLIALQCSVLLHLMVILPYSHVKSQERRLLKSEKSKLLTT